MSIEVKVPQLPESVADATLVSWHKGPGDQVSRDENLVDLETDKVVLEVPAPVDGTLAEHKVAEGEVVEANALLALIEVARHHRDAEAAKEHLIVIQPQATADQVQAGVGKGDFAVFHDIPLVCHLQRKIGILFYEKYRGVVFGIYFF